MDTVEADGLRIGYERAAAGPPLVLLHGHVGNGPTTWRRRLPRLVGGLFLEVIQADLDDLRRACGDLGSR